MVVFRFLVAVARRMPEIFLIFYFENLRRL